MSFSNRAHLGSGSAMLFAPDFKGKKHKQTKIDKENEKLAAHPQESSRIATTDVGTKYSQHCAYFKVLCSN